MKMINKIGKLIIKNRGFILTLLLLFMVRWSFADHYRVPTGSMIPTIEIGDHVLVNKIAYDLKIPFTKRTLIKLGEPKRGDIIVFEYPHNPSTNYTKRLIGLPGDEIEVVNGLIKINGELTLENKDMFDQLIEKLSQSNTFQYKEVINQTSFVVKRTPRKLHRLHQKFIVPKNHYFFMGDNRDNSADSRYWGFVHRKHLLGKVLNVTYSITFDGLLPHLNWKRTLKKLL